MRDLQEVSADAAAVRPQGALARCVRWNLPRDRGFQAGLRLSIFSPFVSYLCGELFLSGEAGLGWGFLHVAAFGVVEAMWIAPLAAVCAALRWRRFALGLTLGGVMLLFANGLAWLVGLVIGAR
jgi:hypothetical protein